MKNVIKASVKELAQQELNAENEKKAVKLYKEKLIELEKAKRVVKNIEREIEDLEEQIENGDL